MKTNVEVEKFEEYQKWVAPVKKVTRLNYKSALSLYCNFTGLNPKQLIDEAEKDFEKPRRQRGKPKQRLIDFYNYLVNEYRPKKKNGKRLSPYKAKIIVKSLKGFYSRNGFKLGEIKLPRVAPRKENARIELSISDIRRMVEVAPTVRDKAIILFGFQGGFDVNTLVKLDLGDFSDKDLSKLLNNEMPETPVLLHIVREKEGIDYHTCLGFDAVDMFRQYLNERRLRGEELSLNSPCFVKEGSKKRSYQRIDKPLVHYMMREVALKAGVVSKERLERADFNIAGFHALRATFSRRLEYAGMPVAYIDYMQGHALPHGGAYRKPNPKKLLEKYGEFEHVLSISKAPKSITEIEEKLKRELDKERAYTRELERRIARLEEKLEVMSKILRLE